ncbi:ArsR/SmtB family transcription factor [Kribbella sp. NPDC050124]|uniref:ArsR/SmtB family transcription factor n=1 Tax=Kribbella sp. NPDC050124 TaxID=3364114 RepID=UPI00378CB559
MDSSDAVLDALGDRTRRAILERLRTGPQPVVEIARGLSVGRPAVSQHLKILKQASLVVDHAVGTRRVYEINPDGLETLQDYARSFWSAALTRYQRAAQLAASQEQGQEGDASVE